MKTNKNYMAILNTETNYKEINEGVAYGAKNPIIPLFKKSVPSNIKKMWGISKKAEIEYAFANGYEFPFYVTTMPILYADCDIRYQRFINVDRILGIIAKFDPAKIEAKVVSLHDDGSCRMADGDHQSLILYLMGYAEQPVRMFINLTPEQEAIIFATQDDDKSRVSQIAKRNARGFGGDEAIRIQDKIIKEFGLTFYEKAHPLYSDYHNITTARGIKEVWDNYGEEGFRFALQAIRDCGWENEFKMYKQAGLAFGGVVYKYFKDEPIAYKAFIESMKTITFKIWESLCVKVAKEAGKNVDKHPETAVRFATDKCLGEGLNSIGILVAGIIG